MKKSLRLITAMAAIIAYAASMWAQPTTQECAQAWRNAGTDTCARRTALEQWQRIAPADDADLAMAECEYYRSLAATTDVVRTSGVMPIDTTDFHVVAIDSVAHRSMLTPGTYDSRIMGKAIAALQRGIAANPDRLDLHTTLMASLADAGKFSDAVAEIHTTLNRDSAEHRQWTRSGGAPVSHPADAIAQGVAYTASRMINASDANAPTVIATCRAALKRCPHNATMLRPLESTLMLTEDYQGAIEVQQQLLALSPGDCQVLSDAAMAYMATGQTAKAAQCCRKVKTGGDAEQRQWATEMLNMILGGF